VAILLRLSVLTRRAASIAAIRDVRSGTIKGAIGPNGKPEFFERLKNENWPALVRRQRASERCLAD
jgi:hypothetical protein